jgi:outer membrane protein OmpA-like peptidoglycan-associated protein
MAETLAKHQSNITISGHTSRLGSKAYNQVLSERRAGDIEYMKHKFDITADKLQGFGELQPTAKELNTDVNNRRVEINIVFK